MKVNYLKLIKLNLSNCFDTFIDIKRGENYFIQFPSITDNVKRKYLLLYNLYTLQ